MIILNNKTRQDFLDRDWCQKLLDAGVDMSDAKYFIFTNPDNGQDYIGYKLQMDVDHALNCVPTYTLSEILYKLDEYPFIDEVGAPLGFVKDAPFYSFFYQFKRGEEKLGTVEGLDEYPLYAAAQLLLTSIKTGINYVKDISDK